MTSLSLKFKKRSEEPAKLFVAQSTLVSGLVKKSSSQISDNERGNEEQFMNDEVRRAAFISDPIKNSGESKDEYQGVQRKMLFFRKKKREATSVESLERIPYSFFILYSKKTKMAKFLLIMEKTVVPQILAVGAINLTLYLQGEVWAICFHPQICANCKGLPARLWTAFLKGCGTYPVSCLVGYYALTAVKEFKKLRWIGPVYFGLMNFTLVVVYVLIEDDVESGLFTHTDIAMFANFMIGILISIYLGFYRARFELKVYLRKFKPGFISCSIMYLCFNFTAIAMSQIRNFLTQSFGEASGQNYQQLIVAAINNLIIYLFFLLSPPYSRFLKSEQMENNNPHIFLTKVMLNFITAQYLCNLLQINTGSWGFWLSMVDYVLILFRFHTGFSVLIDSGVWLWEKVVSKKKHVLSDWIKNMEFYRILGFQHIEIMLIYIFNIGTLIFWDRWLFTNHRVYHYYRDCSLGKSSAFPMKLQNFFIFSLFDVLVTALILVYSRYRKLAINIYYVEEQSSLVRAILTMSFHYYLQYYLLIFDSFSK